MKLHWHNLIDFYNENILSFHGSKSDNLFRTLSNMLDHYFNEGKYILLTRNDKARQAVSFWLAAQTGQWRRYKGDDLPPVEHIKYDYNSIEGMYSNILEQENNWKNFFDFNNIAPLVVKYEYMITRFDECVNDVMNYISGDTSAKPTFPGMERQNYEISDQLVEKFKADLGQASSKPLRIQPKAEIEEFYSLEDPWQYDSTPDDAERRARLLSAIPQRHYRRTLDIGCGNGFLTVHLPGKQVIGCDLSEEAINWARKRVAERSDSERFTFFAGSIFDLTPEAQGTFDLIVITGVLYPEYIGSSWSLVNDIIDRLLEPGGILATSHIYELCRHRFPYLRIDQAYYPYREYTHRLEVYLK